MKILKIAAAAVLAAALSVTGATTSLAAGDTFTVRVNYPNDARAFSDSKAIYEPGDRSGGDYDYDYDNSFNDRRFGFAEAVSGITATSSETKILLIVFIRIVDIMLQIYEFLRKPCEFPVHYLATAGIPGWPPAERARTAK